MLNIISLKVVELIILIHITLDETHGGKVMGALIIVGIYSSMVLFAMYQVNKSNKVRLDAWSKLGK